MNENEPKIEITPPEKKKKPKLLWKRMKELEQLGWSVYKLEESGPWISCQVCGEQAHWQIDSNQYCNKCMSGKTDEFKEAIKERKRKRMGKEEPSQ